MSDYEYRVLTFRPEVSRADMSHALTEYAEYGRWELSRVVLYWGGVRRAWIRRRVIRVQRTA